MSKGQDPIGSLRIAAPCQMSWEGMAGDERVRHCTLCSLNVYNFAEMTRDEVRQLLVRTEGRVCARLYRRADGTVLTRDCPTGLRAMQRRASRIAAALITALLTLPSLAFGGTIWKKPRFKTGSTASSAHDNRVSSPKTRAEGILMSIPQSSVTDSAVPSWVWSTQNSKVEESMRVVSTLFLATLVLCATTGFAQSLPSNPQQTCTANIAPWFQSGSVTLNGVVNPANSLNLDTSTNCNFYLWSEQMFLWMTSPASSIYGGNGRVFQSPVFYAITSCGSNGSLCFVPQFPIPPFIPPIAASDAKAQASAPKLPPLKNAKQLKNFQAALRPSKRGPNGLPVVIDRQGRPIEITDAQLSPRGKPLVVGANGKVEISKITRDASTKKIQFIDAAGKVIAKPKPVLSAALKKANAGQRFFMSDGTALVVDSGGVVLDVSPEQAGSVGAVLLSQQNSVVYYTTVVNDVYAWFLTGVANGAINTNNQFPTTQADLNQITAYAAQYGVTLSDANALTMEAKLSWVDASTLSNPSAYITTQAEVPVYNTSSSTSWPQTSNTVVTLALLGIHVVGTSNGHPEMIWATFEHFGNTPNGTYQYVNTGGSTTTVNQNTSGSWVLTANGSSGPFNVAHANYLSAPTINAQSGQTISESDTLREYAFGVAPTGIPNQNDATPAIANTEVISLNNSVLGQLASGDVRANYYFVGSTWTFGGFAPTQPYPVVIQTPNANINGAEIGTSYLTNSTMETYQQATATTASTNCFSCHNNGGSTPPPGTAVTTAVSHIFSSLLPLFSSSSTTAAKTPAKKKSTK